MSAPVRSEGKRNDTMVLLGIVLVLTGAGLLVAEAHLPTYGLLGLAGVVSLVAGGARAPGGPGGGPLPAAVRGPPPPPLAPPPPPPAARGGAPGSPPRPPPPGAGARG